MSQLTEMLEDSSYKDQPTLESKAKIVGFGIDMGSYPGDKERTVTVKLPDEQLVHVFCHLIEQADFQLGQIISIAYRVSATNSSELKGWVMV